MLKLVYIGRHAEPRPCYLTFPLHRRHKRTLPEMLRGQVADLLHPPASTFEIVAIASSAGGLKALSEVLKALPASFSSSIVVVQHLDPRHRSLMADILSRRTPLQVKEAEEGDKLLPGTVYIAPPNQHLLVNPDHSLSLSQSELVHFVRPSADLLFESTAGSFKERAIAVVLSGSGSDGSMGVPAIQTGCVDFVLSLQEIAPALITLAKTGRA